MRMSLSGLVKTTLSDSMVTANEASALERAVLSNGKVSKAEATQLRRVLNEGTRFEPGAKERLSALLVPPPPKRPQMTLAQATTAAKALGAQMNELRLGVRALELDLSDPATFSRVMTEKFGPARDGLPFSQPGALTMTPIWPGVAPYPRIAIEPTSGALYFNDESLSPKWFGPLTPAAGARILGTFTDEDARYEIGSAYVAGEHGR